MQEANQRQTQRDLDQAEFVAKADANLIAALQDKNIQLETLCQERDTMSQKLAARNDRLSDATHDLKHRMIPMAYKVQNLIDTANTEASRADALWLQQEMIEIADKMAKIVYEAKITNPLPPMLPATNLPIQPLAPYFFERFNSQAVEKDVTLKCACYGRPASSAVDEDLLKRIIANLLTNAIDYAKPDGAVSLAFYGAPTCCYVHLIDNGPGMAGLNSLDRAANFDKLIEQLEKAQFLQYQANQQEAQADAGNGVGLINVARLCKQAGIGITLHSSLGRGTFFRLRLPGAQPA